MIEKELTVEDIKKLIYVVNNKKVMLDSDIAKIYNMETKRINENVNRNIDKFSSDIYFKLNEKEIENFNLRSQNNSLRSQSATSSLNTYGGRRYFPYAFTLDGIETLNSILKSKGSIELLILFKSAFEDENNIIIKPKALDLSETNIKAMIYNVRVRL